MFLPRRLADLIKSSGTTIQRAAGAMAGIIEAVANGDMTPDEARSVTSIIEQYRRTLETTELENRLQALEQATAEGNLNGKKSG